MGLFALGIVFELEFHGVNISLLSSRRKLVIRFLCGEFLERIELK
jgi:hypothetical protein